MQVYQGKARVPGVDSEWIIVLELDWDKKSASVNVEGQTGHISSWQGLALQTFGDYEISFKTKGIPPLLTHWWHFVKPDENHLWGMIIGLPDKSGNWLTCPVELNKVTS